MSNEIEKAREYYREFDNNCSLGATQKLVDLYESAITEKDAEIKRLKDKKEKMFDELEKAEQYFEHKLLGVMEWLRKASKRIKNNDSPPDFVLGDYNGCKHSYSDAHGKVLTIKNKYK